MTEAQKHLIDNNDSLEKKSGTLSIEEKSKLEGIKNNSDVIENAKATKFDIKLKDGTNVKISAEVLIKVIAKAVSLSQGTNYKQKLENADIKVKIGDKIKSIDNSQLGRGSELMAFLQVAAGGNLVPDGKFGEATALAFSQLLSPVKTETKAETETKFEAMADLSKITAYDYKYPFNVLLGNNAKSYDQYKIFSDVTGREGYFSNCIVNSSTKDVTITYYSPIAKSDKTITFKRDEIIVTGHNTKVDVNKFMTALKTKLDSNEAKIQKEKGKESVSDGIEDVDVTAFSSLIQEYIKDDQQDWVTNGEIDFDSKVGNSGMEVKGDKLYITYPRKGTGGKDLVVPYLLSSVQTNNKFDQKKFVNVVSKTLNPRAKEWKAGEFAETYNILNKNSIGSINTTKAADEKVNDYKSLKNNIDKYSTLGVVVDSKVSTGIDKKISEIEKRKEYIKMKNSDESKVKGFEDFLSKKTPKTAGEQMAFQNEINSKKGEYKNFRDDFNKRVTSYVKISYTDRTNFNDRLKKIDRTYGYN